MAVNISICTRKRNGCFLSVVLCITDYSCNLYLKNTNYSWLSADGASDYKPASRLWIVVFQQWNRVPELLRGFKKMESGQSIPHGACDKYFDLKKLRFLMLNWYDESWWLYTPSIWKLKKVSHPLLMSLASHSCICLFSWLACSPLWSEHYVCLFHLSVIIWKLSHHIKNTFFNFTNPTRSCCIAISEIARKLQNMQYI